MKRVKYLLLLYMNVQKTNILAVVYPCPDYKFCVEEFLLRRTGCLKILILAPYTKNGEVEFFKWNTLYIIQYFDR